MNLTKLFIVITLLFFFQNVYSQAGTNDSSFNEFNKYSGADNIVRSIAVQPDGKIIAIGLFKYYNGIYNSAIVRLNVDGSLDESFVTGKGFNSSASAIAIQSDGKIIVGGGFTKYNDKDQRHIVRLNPDGSLDESFSLKLNFYDDVSSVVVQPDGKIIIGGDFTYYNKYDQISNILRLNPDGSLDENFIKLGFWAGFNYDVESIALQPDGKVIVGGKFTSFNNKSQNYIVRLNVDGSLDKNFSVGDGFNGSVSLVFVQFDGKILVKGGFSIYNGTTTQDFVRLNSDGSLDKDFSFKLSYGGDIYSIAQQSNGKIILVGSFDLLSEKNIVRLNLDGSIDDDFKVGLGFNFPVYTVALQIDGKMIVGGDFTEFNNLPSNRTARLNVDGSLDGSFVTESGFDSMFDNAYIAVVQDDDKILVGGGFSRFNRVTQNRICRLNPDGSLDESFKTGTGFEGISEYINSIAVQSDRKIIVGGNLYNFNGVNVINLARLNSDGSLDQSFKTGTGFDENIYTIVLQSDGKIIVGGNFHSYNDVRKDCIVRLNTDGSLDDSFKIGTGFSGDFGDLVYSIVLQPDGKIIVGGNFNSYNLTLRNGLARLNPDGSLDESFKTGTGFNGINISGTIKSIAVQSDGRIVVGGNFSTFDGVNVRNLVRLNPDGTLDDSFVSRVGFGYSGTVNSIVTQSDGKIVVGGRLNFNDNMSENIVIRLNSDGSFDDDFETGSGFNGRYVQSIALQSNNKIIIVGGFTSFNSILRSGIVRLHGDNSLSTLLYQAPLSENILFPNPVNDILNINSSKYNQAKVFDMSGRLVKTTIIFNQQINLSDLLFGNYMIQLQGNNDSKIFKIVKR